MEPTLRIGQRVLVDRIGNDFFAPSVGDIVVFHPPAGATNQICGARSYPGRRGLPAADAARRRRTTNYIKRVVAGPGDTIAIRDGHVILNGKRQKEPLRELRRLHDVGPSCNYPHAVQGSGRLLLHDGRQP